MPKNKTLHFAHANGFPAGSYKKLLDHLKSDYTVVAIEKVGHNPSYPVNDNWSNLVNELIGYIKENTSEPIIGVGHSLGAILTFMAACNNPKLFRQVIMLDPPPIQGLFAFLLLFAKKLRIMDRVKEVSHTKKRRTQWASREEAEDYFRGKSLFKHFDPDSLINYVQHGTTATECGVKLIFDVNVEADIFKMSPHNINSFKRSLEIPGIVIIGKNTYSLSKYVQSRFAKRHHFHFKQLDFGGHLFPFEYPEQTTTLIRETIDKLNGSTKI